MTTFVTVPATNEPTSLYATRSDIEDIYGITNVAKWADINNDGVSTEDRVTDRVNKALSRATAEINDRLRGSRYSIPFTEVPNTVVYLCALYAGIWLYSSRGVTDYDPNGKAQDQLSYQRKEFNKKIRMFWAGQIETEISSITGVVTYPKIVT